MQYQYDFGIAKLLLGCNLSVLIIQYLNRKLFNLFLDDAGGASDSWALMAANITHSYTIEIGPTTDETENDPFLLHGFHVDQSRIHHVVEQAYILLNEYLKTFVFTLKKKFQNEIIKDCTQMYNENYILKNLN
jgi:hypothetical protein